MPLLRRGSPLGHILLLGTCLSLALPIAPALADPAALPDWGVASKTAAEPTKPPDAAPAPTTSTPEPTPEAPAAPEPTPAAAAEPEPDIVLEPDDEAAPPPPRRRAPRPKSKPKPKPKPAAQSAAAPAPVAAPPAPLVPVDEPRRSDPSAALRRKASGELISGALLASGGLASFGVMSGGLYLNRLSERELDKGEGRPAEDLAPLHDQQRRAETMVAAGAIAGAAGLALGVALLAIGARDLKATRREPLAARVRIAPTIGGLVLAGRF